MGRQCGQESVELRLVNPARQCSTERAKVSTLCIGVAVRHGRLHLQGWDLVEICGGPDRQMVLLKVIPERFCSLLEGLGAVQE